MSVRLDRARERERTQVMREVSALAVRLFDEDGYDDVTMQQVADATDMSVATLYRRFGTKENLVCWQPDENSAMARLVASVQEGTTVITAAIELAHGLPSDAVDAIEASAHARLRLMAGHAALQAAARDKSESFIDSIVAAGNAADPHERLQHEVEARCVSAAFDAAHHAWLRGDGSLRDCTLRALEALAQAGTPR